jgi:hypothetical protein
MASHLHLLTVEASPLAVAAIASAAGQPEASVTVVLLDGVPEPPLPAGARVLRLGAGGLDHGALVELIFSSDHVISW